MRLILILYIFVKKIVCWQKKVYCSDFTIVDKNLYYHDFCHCDMWCKATIIVVVKTLLMTATSDVFANLFAAVLIPTTCNDIFYSGKTYFAETLFFSQQHMSLQKTNFLVVSTFCCDRLRSFCLIRVESDSLIAIKLIKDGCSKKHESVQLVQDIHRIYNDEGTIMSNNIYK